jgi:hypothetical protein
METYSKEDRHYIAGFEAGCDFIVMEIERWGKQHNLYVQDILHHLRTGNGKSNTVSDENRTTNWDLL